MYGTAETKAMTLYRFFSKVDGNSWLSHYDGLKYLVFPPDYEEKFMYVYLV